MREITIVGGPRNGTVLHDVADHLRHIRIPDPLPADIIRVMDVEPRRTVVAANGRLKARPNPAYVPPETVEVPVTTYRIQRDRDGRWYALHPEVPL